jgi:hypothetical protein
VAESTVGDRVLSCDEAVAVISRKGVNLVLGYHPRANLGLGIGLCLEKVKNGLKCLVIDCDRTVALEGQRPALTKEEAVRVLVSHPEDLAALKADIEAARWVPDAGMVLLNRASSLVLEYDPLRRFEAKRKLWESINSSLRAVGARCPAVVLEDARKHDQVEYKVHPALFYISDTILDSVEEGKSVSSYRLTKKRDPPPSNGRDRA